MCCAHRRRLRRAYTHQGILNSTKFSIPCTHSKADPRGTGNPLRRHRNQSCCCIQLGTGPAPPQLSTGAVPPTAGSSATPQHQDVFRLPLQAGSIRAPTPHPPGSRQTTWRRCCGTAHPPPPAAAGPCTSKTAGGIGTPPALWCCSGADRWCWRRLGRTLPSRPDSTCPNAIGDAPPEVLPQGFPRKSSVVYGIHIPYTSLGVAPVVGALQPDNFLFFTDSIVATNFLPEAAPQASRIAPVVSSPQPRGEAAVAAAAAVARQAQPRRRAVRRQRRCAADHGVLWKRIICGLRLKVLKRISQDCWAAATPCG